MTTPLRNRNDRRINLRATSAQESLIRAAEDRRGVSMTDFVLQSACSKAEEAIADRDQTFRAAKLKNP